MSWWDRPEHVEKLAEQLESLTYAVRVGAVEVGYELPAAVAYRVLNWSAQLAAAVASNLPDPTFPPTP